MKITSKKIFFDLWEAGVLGNRTRLWKDPYAALADARRLDIKEIGFREVRPMGAGAGKWEKVPTEQLLCTAAKWVSEGRKFLLDDGAPDWCRTLQGEICRTYRGLEGYLDTIGRYPMRPAMAAGDMRHCSGATVLALVQRFMDPSSQDDLWDLLDLYPDAAIEFSCFRIDVGIFPHRNTLFWETRNY